MAYGNDHTIIIALLIVLVVIIAWQGSGWMSKRNGGNGGGACGAKSGGSETFTNPWLTNDKQFAAVQGNPDGPKILRDKRWLIPQLARANASATPEELHKAERAAWFSARDAGKRATFDTERMYNTEDLTMQEHETEPQINWQDSLIDLVADKRIRENQRKWNAEVQPWNTTWLKVDDIDEASVFGLGGPGNAQGLYTFSRGGVNVHNPMFLTDVGPTEFSVMKPFRFNG